MAINLQKGQKIDIGLSKITVGLGWDPNEGTGHDFDLDASAIMINSERKLLSDNHFIFYNNLCGLGHDNPNQCKNNNCSPGQFGLLHTGDDPDGKSSDGDDDEAIEIDLSKVSQDVQEILFVVTIAEFEARKQNFGQVRNSFIRIVDDSNDTEMVKYELEEDFSIETAVEFGRIYNKDGQWKFEAIGAGMKGGLQDYLNKYN